MSPDADRQSDADRMELAERLARRHPSLRRLLDTVRMLHAKAEWARTAHDANPTGATKHQHRHWRRHWERALKGLLNKARKL